MILSILNNLIFKINRWHLLENGAGELPYPSGESKILNFFSRVFASIIEYVSSVLGQLANALYLILCKFVYFIVKIVLNIMDFVMVIISELSGQAQGYDMNAVNSNLENSDILFRFLLNSYTITILKRVFVYALFILILITIFAIVMNEWRNATQNQTNTYKKTLFRTLNSIFMMFLLPFIVIVGIIASNVILASLVASVNPDKSTRFSVGATLFASATFDANLYRTYADNGQKIPIVFDFDGGFENARDNVGKDKELQDNDFLNSGYSTYSMFVSNKYFTFNQVPEDSSYYNYYDGQYLKTRRIEYYVMADFIDYAMQSGEEFYIKNAEDVFLDALQVLKKYNNLDPLNNKTYTYYNFLYPYIETGEDGTACIDYNEFDAEYLSGFEEYNFSILRNVFSTIRPFDKDDKEIPLYKKIDNRYEINEKELASVAYYKIVVKYDSTKFENIESGDSSDVEYICYPGASNEIEGAVYLFTTKTTLKLKDIEVYRAQGLEKYIDISLNVPVLKNSGSKAIQYGKVKNNTRSASTLYTFKSNYLSTNRVEDGLNLYKVNFIEEDEKEPHSIALPTSPFIARGAFTTAGLPTAIRESGGDIVMYRHHISSPKSMELEPITSYMATGSNGETTNISGDDFFSRVLGFGNSQIDSSLTAKVSATQQFYKTEFSLGNLKNGFYTLNYSFMNTPLSIDNIYDLGEVNIILLVVASFTLLQVLVYIIFGLIKRLLELTVLWFTYPAWLLKYPLGSGTGSIMTDNTFQHWAYRFMEKVFSVYALYIGLALYYAFVPVVMATDVIPTSIVIEAGSGNVFNSVSPELVGWLLNAMFVLVLFTFVEKIETMVGEYVMKGSVGTGSTLSAEGKEVFSASVGNVKKAVDTLNVKKQIKNAATTVVGYATTAKDMIPGSAIMGDAVKAVKQHNNNKKYAGLVKDLGAKFASATSQDDVTNAIKGSATTKNITSGKEKINQYQQESRALDEKTQERRKRVMPKNKK